MREITEHPENPNRLWVVVDGIDWNDDDKVMDFIEYTADKETDILVDYGYSISLMPVSMTVEA